MPMNGASQQCYNKEQKMTFKKNYKTRYSSLRKPL